MRTPFILYRYTEGNFTLIKRFDALEQDEIDLSGLLKVRAIDRLFELSECARFKALREVVYRELSVDEYVSLLRLLFNQVSLRLEREGLHAPPNVAVLVSAMRFNDVDRLFVGVARSAKQKARRLARNILCLLHENRACEGFDVHVVHDTDQEEIGRKIHFYFTHTE